VIERSALMGSRIFSTITTDAIATTATNGRSRSPLHRNQGPTRMSDVSQPEYWSKLYQTNEAGWDKGRCAPPIARLLAEGFLSVGAHVSVIGCGPGHEAFEAARLGFEVTAIDFAPEAIAAVRAMAAERQLNLHAAQADIFDLAQRWPGHFDAIIEHTCLCAIDPARREEYTQAIAGALKPSGLLCGLFYAHNRPAGPPYSIDENEVRRLFAPRFHLGRLTIAPDSFENRAGQELEFIARRRD